MTQTIISDMNKIKATFEKVNQDAKVLQIMNYDSKLYLILVSENGKLDMSSTWYAMPKNGDKVKVFIPTPDDETFFSGLESRTKTYI